MTVRGTIVEYIDTDTGQVTQLAPMIGSGSGVGAIGYKILDNTLYSYTVTYMTLFNWDGITRHCCDVDRVTKWVSAVEKY